MLIFQGVVEKCLDYFFVGTFNGLGEHLIYLNILSNDVLIMAGVFVWLVIFLTDSTIPTVNHHEKPPLGRNICVCVCFFPANFKQIYVCCFDG